jgi:hypothetical protein
MSLFAHDPRSYSSAKNDKDTKEKHFKEDGDIIELSSNDGSTIIDIDGVKKPIKEVSVGFMNTNEDSQLILKKTLCIIAKELQALILILDLMDKNPEKYVQEYIPYIDNYVEDKSRDTKYSKNKNGTDKYKYYYVFRRSIIGVKSFKKTNNESQIAYSTILAAGTDGKGGFVWNIFPEHEESFKSNERGIRRIIDAADIRDKDGNKFHTYEGLTEEEFNLSMWYSFCEVMTLPNGMVLYCCDVTGAPSMTKISKPKDENIA